MNWYKKSSKIDQVVRLVNKGLNIQMAMEQVLGIGNASPNVMKQVQQALRTPPGGKFPIKTMSSDKKKKDWDPNPWAVCTDSVGREDSDKYERCVKKVKNKQSKMVEPFRR